MQRACLGPRARDVLWAGSFRRVPCWASLFPRASAREGCAREGGMGGSSPHEEAMAGSPVEPELAARPAALAVPLAALTHRR